jgi:ribosomal protein L40E
VGKLVWRGKHRKGDASHPGKITHPSTHAPANFFERDEQRRLDDRHSAAEDRESDFGNCAQCGAPQALSEAETCYNCGSDNRLNRKL